MKEGTIYKKATGEITMTVVAPDEEGVQLQIMGREDELGIVFDEQIDSGEFYIVDGKASARPSMTLSLSGNISVAPDEILRVESIPEGSHVLHPDGFDQVDDGFIEWSTSVPGTYFIKVFKFPYKEVQINAIVG